MIDFLTALLLGAALSVMAAGLAWLAGLALQSRARPAQPGLWRSARLVAVLPMLAAPVLYAIPQTLPGLPALDFIDEPVALLLTANPEVEIAVAAPLALALPSLEWMLAGIYALGLIAALALALRRHGQRRRLLRQSRIAARHERILLDREAEKLGLPAPELRFCSRAATPFLTGWRGLIIAPESLLHSPELARHALVHELCHLRRGDERDRLVGSALTILFWFNWPLRQIERELDAAREIACDRHAIAALGHTQRKAYAATLIETMRTTAQPVSAFGPHDRRHREMRIKAILSGGQTVRHSLLTAGALLLLAIPVACAQTAVTPRRVVADAVDQTVPQIQVRQISEAHSDQFRAAIALQDEQDWDAVIQALDPIIGDSASSAHDRSIALQLRGRADYELDRIDAAIADWQAAIDTGAMEQSAADSYRINIAQLLTAAGRYDEAIAAFDVALAGDVPVPQNLKRMLAQTYGQAGRFEEGLSYAEAVYQAAPDDRQNQQLMLFYFQQTGMDAEAAALAPLVATEAPAAPRQKVSSVSPAPAAAAAPAVQPSAAPNATAPNLSRSIVQGHVTSPYGSRPARPVGAPVFHGGTDIGAPTGTAISAPGAGTVTHAAMGYGGSDRWGNTIEIDHGNGWSTIYAHLNEIDVEPGQAVSAGETIGTVGSTGVATGPHVHVEVHHDGQRVDPADYLTGLN